VSLAANDPIAILDGVSTVVAYVDSNARMLTSATLNMGDLARFTGVLFNDNGTLRLDCSQVNDGVPE
jgi:hypothetical protein